MSATAPAPVEAARRARRPQPSARDARRTTRALVDRRQVRRARLAADHRRPDHHRDRLPVAELELPDRRQLRQPDRAGGRLRAHRPWGSCSCCCWARSTCRSATSVRRGGVLVALLTPPRQRQRARRRPSRSSWRSARASRSARSHGLLITKIGIPSFVVTLAGLLAWNGVVLLLIGGRGTVILQNTSRSASPTTSCVGQRRVDPRRSPASRSTAAMLFWQRAQARRARASPRSDAVLLLRIAVAWPFAAFWRSSTSCNQDRGIPYVVLVRRRPVPRFWTFVLNRTRFGRHIYAVGGNTEAARRAGINVDNIKIACFAHLLVDGGRGRHRARLAPALGRHERGRRLDPAVLDRRRGDRRHVAVRRPRPREERGARRARHRARSTTASACSAWAPARSSSSPAACCCWR